MSPIREKFVEDVNMCREELITPKVLVIAVELPNGGVETEVNYHEIDDKLDYLINTYDEYFVHKYSKDEVKIVGYMLV